MRVIKSDTGFLFYEKIFKQLMANQSSLVVWQLSPDSGERQITRSRLNAYHMDTGKLHLEIDASKIVNDGLPLYCFSEDGPLIFKAQIHAVSGSNISVGLPAEIKVFDDPDVVHIQGVTGKKIDTIWRTKKLDTGYSPDNGPDLMHVKSMSQRSSRDQELLNNEFGLSVDEEDKLFADKRESPRARPKMDKWVKIAKLRGDGPVVYKLFDLSQGGMGFVSFDETEFTKGTQIHIVGFNDFDLDDPLVGKVMSIRPIDGVQSEFKIGVAFTEGQN
ncbi:MAG: PilZ domain-containing protein [Bdellovibrionales bacterium]|nr:PilZ domain-containing protein [Bdellovibrionales bacterium]